MEPIEKSESIASSTKEEPHLASQSEPLSPIPHHDHNDPHDSDPNHLDEEFQNKLGLKDEDEPENKGSNFEVGSEQLRDGDASPEHGKSQRSNDDHPHGDDGWNDDNHGGDEWNDDNHGDDGWNKLDLKDEDETENKGSNFEVGSEQLGDGDASPEHCKSQRSNDNHHHVDDGWNDGNHGDDGWNDDNHGGDGCNDDGWNDDGWNGGDEGYDWNENVNENENVGGYVDEVGNNDERNSDRAHQQYPLRPEAEDCAFYLKTGACKFGSSCKFNHPVRRKNLVVKEVGERDELEERSTQPECKYYSRSEGCKFGKACKFNHTRGEFSAAPVTELNFLGLPIRSGEKECLYYMRNGSCKFGASCKFNHPDPTSIGGTSGYSNGDSISLQGVSKSSIPSWSSTRTLNETSSPYVPIVTPGVSPRGSDWNGYQAPVYPPSTYVVNNPAIETKVYMHHQKLMSVEEFPERPGEPECSYFLKTGDCKFKSNCKFHHPKHRGTRLSPCNLSDKGLPLRPGQIVCTHYSRYGICKFGPACRFDHPITMPGFGDSSDATIQ